MPAYRTETVAEVLTERPGLQQVRLANGERAYVLTQLVGDVRVADEVVVNTTAVDLGLGTGGWHVVHWNLSRREWAQAGPGHLMKLRYTSLQADTGGGEEHVDDLGASLGGRPVVACTLHSQMACVAAAFKAHAPDRRLAYVMTDGAALPIALSDLVADLRRVGLLDLTVTAGHAFGGDLEAVTVASGLALAVDAGGADAVVVAMGPGVVGSGSRLGTTAIEAAAVLDTVAALDGVPLACLRWSDADPRPRHRGLSHHWTTVLELVRSTVIVPVPDEGRTTHDRHHVVVADPGDVVGHLAGHGLHVTSMGRGPDADPAFYAVAGAAGAAAAAIVSGRIDGS